MHSTPALQRPSPGALKVLVRTGLGESSLGEYRHTWAGIEPDYIAADLREAADWLLSTTN